MEPRVVIAFVLALGVLIGWQFIVPPPVPVQEPVSVLPDASEKSPEMSPKSASVSPAMLADTTSSTPPQTTVLENDNVALTLSSANGGGIDQIVLKKFFKTPQHETPYTLFATGKGGPLFRVYEEHGGCFQKPPQLRRVSLTQAQLVYECSKVQGTARVTYTLTSAYTVGLEVQFSSQVSIFGKELWVSFPVEPGQKPHLSQFNTEQVGFAIGEKVEFVSVSTSGVASGQLTAAPVDWFSFGDRYFFVGLLASEKFKPIATVTVENPHAVFLKFLFPKESTSEMTWSAQGYVGPKDRVLLQGLGTLDRVIDFGFFTILAIPIWHFLKFFYNNVWANFGIAIIVLTILVRLLFLPLTLKGMGNMQAMQKLQPQIKTLREKYAQDRQKLNQETMLLMRTHKVNPLGGCLPILIQIPVFIALYAVLSNAVELYHAYFGLWIHDLSAKDPYYVLPVLLGLSFLVQQKLTPSAVDPNTQKIMMIMPIVFTVFMVNLPAGLNLYIFTSTVLGIVQQVVMNRKTKMAISV